MRTTQLLKTKLAGLLIVALCASLVAPALAGAQQVDPTTSQYSDRLTQVAAGGQPPSSRLWARGQRRPAAVHRLRRDRDGRGCARGHRARPGLQRAVSRDPGDDRS